MGRQVNASSKPTRAVAECEMTNVHVHDEGGDCWDGGQAPCRPKAIGRRVHLGFQCLGCLSFNFAEIHSPRSHTLPAVSTRVRLPRLRDVPKRPLETSPRLGASSLALHKCGLAAL